MCDLIRDVISCWVWRRNRPRWRRRSRSAAATDAPLNGRCARRRSQRAIAPSKRACIIDRILNNGARPLYVLTGRCAAMRRGNSITADEPVIKRTRHHCMRPSHRPSRDSARCGRRERAKEDRAVYCQSLRFSDLSEHIASFWNTCLRLFATANTNVAISRIKKIARI